VFSIPSHGWLAPIGTPEQRELVPPEARTKLEKMVRAQLRMIHPGQMTPGGMDGGAAPPPKTKN
jgi:hypothetical protein